MNVTPEIARVASGATWSVAGTIFVQVLAFVTTILAARSVPPEAYGVVGMALVVVILFGTLRDAGLAPAIASGRLTGEIAWSSAHWAVCGAGAAWSVIALVAAPALGAFFRNPVVADVLRAQSPMFLFTAATVVPQARLQHAGRFRALAGLAAASQLLMTAGVLVSIARDAGLWTLVIPGVVASAVMAPLYWIALGRAPALVFAWSSISRFAREGVDLTAHSLCTYLSRNSDNTLIGRISGDRALGLYSFAYNFLMQPLGVFSHALVPVLLPAFGRVADRERRSDAVVRATVTLVRLGAPVFVGGALTAHLYTPLLFGDRWGDAIPLVRILMIVGALQIVGPVFGTFVLAKGDSRFMLGWGAVTAVASVAVFAAGALLGGPVGVALGYALWTLAVLTVMYAVLKRRFGLPLHGLPRALARVTRDLAAMSVAVLATDALARATMVPVLPRLAGAVLVGAVVYVTLFRSFARDELGMLVALLPAPAARIGSRLLRMPASMP